MGRRSGLKIQKRQIPKVSPETANRLQANFLSDFLSSPICLYLYQFVPLLVTNSSEEFLPPSTRWLGKTKSFNKSIQGQISTPVNLSGGLWCGEIEAI